MKRGLVPAVMGALAAAAVALMLMTMPQALLDRIAAESALLQPPVTLTVRGALAGGAAGIVGFLSFLLLSALEGMPRISLGKRRAPVAIAAPVEEPRRPISAEVELGAPFDSVVAVPAPVRVAAPRAEAAPPEIQSLAELVQRLEAGMRRRGLTPLPPAPIAPRPTPDIDVALRDALGTLERIAARR